ncbi:MAG: DUF1836 domain-containing protein [Oscillospiraceae bacterium]|nr:DUF1836 domain-containing protein [Oscillospiraceae bacterium]
MPYEGTLIKEKLYRWENYLQRFALPDWAELPDTGLRMVEVVALLRGWLDYLPNDLRGERHITAAAINNYVRLRAMPRPRARRYYRIHLAYLLMICTLKQTLSLSMIARLLPSDLTEPELQARYEAYAQRHYRLTADFARTGLEASLPVLEERSGEEAARALVESAAIVSGFSRLMAEKLLLLGENG